MKQKGFLTIRPSIRSKGERRRNAFSFSDRRLKKKKKKKRSGTIYNVRWREYVGGGIFVCPGSSCTDSSRVRGREAQRTMDERGREKRKPTGAEFASGKATSDYFIWLAARRLAFHSRAKVHPRISPPLFYSPPFFTSSPSFSLPFYTVLFFSFLLYLVFLFPYIPLFFVVCN